MNWREEPTARIVKLLKPEFYNKITWLMVISGLALMGTPLLERILNAILKTNFSLSIMDNNASQVGITLVVIGLIYNVVRAYLDQKQHTIKGAEFVGNDKNLFEEFLNQLPSSGSIEFLGCHSFENSFNFDELKQVRSIYHTWRGAEFEFFDVHIETLRKELFTKIGKFVDDSSMKTYPQRNGLQSAIPDMYQGDFTYPEYVQQTIKNLNHLADDVYKTYQIFVKECRKKLT